jgi:radical SAM superfamily enzyme YgiQ (UPF0313 family)
MNIVLISTYELGRQPFGLASPAAWLRKRGHSVECLDLSRVALDEAAVRDAGLIAFYVPMHTATRLTLNLLDAIRSINPRAHIAAYGLYAPLSAESFQARGVTSLFGGEFERSLVDLAEKLENGASSPQNHSNGAAISLERLPFEKPDRTGLPRLRDYAHLVLPSGEHRTVGYTEASRGCKHLCRHCPIVPVYNGVFRIVDCEVVLADVRQQVAAGAQHITFGDPDFFNGIGHAVPLIEAFHREFPELTYDATIKVEHLLKHAELLPALRRTGCLFVVSAIESLDDFVLEKLQKGHTRADFFRVVQLFREQQLAFQPTFVQFTPWTTLDGYLDLLEQLLHLDLVGAVSPIQLGIRLLIPARSRLLELPDIREQVSTFDLETLVYPWKHANPAVDALCEDVQSIAAEGDRQKLNRFDIFEKIWQAANRAAHRDAGAYAQPVFSSRATVPYLNEPWYC